MAGQEIATLYYKITGDTTSFDKSIASADQKSINLGGTFKKVAIGAAAVGAAIIGAGVAAFKLAKDAGQAADKLLDLEQITGLSTNTLQEMKFVAAEAGVSWENLVGAAQKFTAKVPMIEAGTGDAAKAFEKLGVNLRDSQGELRSQDELFPELITSLQGIENITERNSTAQQLFGRSLGDLAPVLGMTAEQFAALRLEANEVGVVLSKSALQNANTFRASLDKLAVQSETTKTAIGATLAPIFQGTLIPALELGNEALTNMANKFSSFVESGEGMEKISDIAGTVSGSLSAMGVIVTPILGSLKTAVGTILKPFQDLSLEMDNTGIGATIFGTAVAAVTGGINILSTIIASVIENFINMAEVVTTTADLIRSGWERATGQISQEEFRAKLAETGDAYKKFGAEFIENSADIFNSVADVVTGFTDNSTASAQQIADAYDTAFVRMKEESKKALEEMQADQEKTNDESTADREETQTEQEESFKSFMGRQIKTYQDAMAAIGDLTSEVGGTISSIWDNVNKFRANQDQAEINRMQALVDATEEGTEARAKAEEALETKKKKLLREQAKREKNAAIFSAVINTSLAVVRAWAENDWVTALIVSALALAAGTAEIAAISNEPLPSAEQGIEIPSLAGVPASGDNQLVRVNGGERIVPGDESGGNLYLDIRLDGQAIAQSTVYNYMNKGRVLLDASRGIA